MVKLLFLAIFASVDLATLPLGQAAAAPDFTAKFRTLLDNLEKLGDADRLHRLFEVDWDYTMYEQPEFATSVGYPGQNDRWSDESAEAIAQRKTMAKLPLEIIQGIDRTKLSEADQVSYDLFRRNAEFEIEGQQFPQELLALSQLSGVQQDLPQTIAQTTFKTTRDYEDLIARLKAVPALIEQNIALMEKGLTEGVTPPQITLREVPQQVLNLLDKEPLESPMLAPFKKISPLVPESDRTRLRQAAVGVFIELVEPAYRKLHEFLVAKYLPGARTTTGFDKMQNGAKWYAFTTRQQTTTNLTPAEIHELGLSEVKRIHAELEKVIADVKFKGSFADFGNFLRTDPRFYYTDAASLLAGYRDIAKRIDPELIKFFGILPRLPYGVIPVPSYAEKSQTTAYYESGSLKAGRPGYFFANTFDLSSRPKWGMETLTLHEAVPGHHLQTAIAEEMEGLPEFRKHGWYTAYGEGWALYAETLGYEMGFFKDPYQNFGHLSDEMWRAVRLVVDTGLHSMSWTRDQAIQYFMENTGSPKHDVEVEIDRYIVWPSQALGYKIGQLKIRELRTKAEKELGSRFDLRAFHDEVLRGGVLPLDILESRVQEWTKKQLSAGQSHA